jgi:hypothetical protein
MTNLNKTCSVVLEVTHMDRQADGTYLSIIHLFYAVCKDNAQQHTNE